MVKFAKNGSDATTAAVKLARAATGRRYVAICRTQPFFSTDDWFIGTTPMRAGVLEEERLDGRLRLQRPGLACRRLLAEHPGDVACVVLEAATALAEPAPGLPRGPPRLADEDGFVLVFDEMITGMRWSLHGAQHVYGVTPDLSTWGKALGNGFAVSALAGRRDLMELGGLRTDAARVFLLSTTHGPETAGLAAYLAVEQAYREWDVVGTMERQGRTPRGVGHRGGGGRRAVPTTSRCWADRPARCSPPGTRTGARPSRTGRCSSRSSSATACWASPSWSPPPTPTPTSTVTVEAVRAALPVYGRAIEPGTVDGLLDGRPVAPALRTHAEPRRWG